MYKKSIYSLVTIIMLIILGVSPVLAGSVVQIEPLTPAPSAETGVITDETPQLWFVELTSNPTADGTSLTTVRAEKAAFRQNARRAWPGVYRALCLRHPVQRFLDPHRPQPVGQAVPHPRGEEHLPGGDHPHAHRRNWRS